MKRVFHWLDENLEEFLLVIGLIAMTLIMGVQVFCRSFPSARTRAYGR